MRSVFLAAAIAAVCAPACASPTFIFTDQGGVGVGTQARAGFMAAAALWSSAFSNNVTIRLDVGFQKLGSGILGSTGSSSTDVAYSDVRTALQARSATATERGTAASLAPTLAFESNTINGVTKASTKVYDTNGNYDNQYLSVNTAEQRALGLLSNNDPTIDAGITFSSAFKWTFDASGGVTRGTYDFVGIAAHEIGHALGFVSGIDSSDWYAKFGYTDMDQTAWGTPLDLFRYQNGIRDWTVGGVPCFSITSGKTCGAGFATGYYTGDHQQASHWKNGKGLGIMNPTVVAGTTLKISGNDLAAFDSLGWDLATTPNPVGNVHWATNVGTAGTGGQTHTLVPEPVNLSFAALGFATFGIARRRATERKLVRQRVGSPQQFRA